MISNNVDISSLIKTYSFISVKQTDKIYTLRIYQDGFFVIIIYAQAYHISSVCVGLDVNYNFTHWVGTYTHHHYRDSTYLHHIDFVNQKMQKFWRIKMNNYSSA